MPHKIQIPQLITIIKQKKPYATTWYLYPLIEPQGQGNTNIVSLTLRESPYTLKPTPLPIQCHSKRFSPTREIDPRSTNPASQYDIMHHQPNFDPSVFDKKEARNSSESDCGCLWFSLSATRPSPQKPASFQIRCRLDPYSRHAFQRPALQWDHEPFYPRQIPPWRSFHRANQHRWY